MSAEFTIVGSQLHWADWPVAFVDAANQGGTGGYGYPEMLDGQSTLWLLPQGGVRGVSVQQDERLFRLRVAELASRADWRLAYSLMRLALARGEGTWRRGDVALGTADLLPEVADAAFEQTFPQDLATFRARLREADRIALPISSFYELRLSPGDLPVDESPEACAALLAKGVARYAEAVPAESTVLSNGYRVTNWSFVATIVREADYVALHAKTPEGEDTQVIVPYPTLVAALGDSSEPCGPETLYLPELDGGAAAQLLTVLLDQQVTVEQLKAPRAGLPAGPAQAVQDLAKIDWSHLVEPLVTELYQAFARLEQSESCARDLVARQNYNADVQAVLTPALVQVCALMGEEGWDELVADAAELRAKLLTRQVPDPLAEALAESLELEAAKMAQSREHVRAGGCLSLLVFLLLAAALAGVLLVRA